MSPFDESWIWNALPLKLRYMYYCKLWNTLQACHIQVYIVSSMIGKPLIKDPNAARTPSSLACFVTTSSCAIKSAPPRPSTFVTTRAALPMHNPISPRTAAQFMGKPAWLFQSQRVFRTSVFVLQDFWICFAFYSQKSVQELQRWVTLCACSPNYFWVPHDDA